jgi:hypothetical protein
MLSLPRPRSTDGTLVLQSHRHRTVNRWIPLCLDSVRAWSNQQGYAYCFVDDAIFTILPPDYHQQFVDRGPVLSDLARLLAIEQALADGWSSVIWVDADLLIYAPDELHPARPSDCAFGREIWIDDNQHGRPHAWRNVHNAFMQFSAGSVVLPYLLMTIQSIASRIETDSVAPQIFGPKLLSALHSITGFDLVDQVTAFSPAVMADIARGQGPYLHHLHATQPAMPAAANLCASVAPDEGTVLAVIERLLSTGLPSG